MPQRLILIFICITATGIFASAQTPSRKAARQLQKGKTVDDTSFVYRIPYAAGTTHRMVQGYFSLLGTHKNRIAVDFKMKVGTPVHAARAGVVIRVRDTGSRGGMGSEYRADGNFISILHNDNSRAVYWHLRKNGAVVKTGDTVLQGQMIGYSGNTGNTAFPHLHFMVWSFDKNGNWYQIPTRFLTDKGPRYLRPFRKYRAVEQ